MLKSFLNACSRASSLSFLDGPPALAAGKLVRKYRLLQKVSASCPTYFCLLAAHYVTDMT